MGAKLIKQLDDWTTHTQKNLIEVQNDNETSTKKAELDWKILRSIGVKVTNMAIGGDSTVFYSEIPLEGGRFLVTVTANIAPNTNSISIDGILPQGLRPLNLEENRTYFNTGVAPNITMIEDRKMMASIQVYGDASTGGTGDQASGKVRIANQHSVARTLSVTYISNPA